MKRLAVVLALGLVGACTSSASTPPSSPAASGSAGPSPGTVAISLQPPVSEDLADAACAIPHQQLLRIWRGTDPERSGQIVFVPQEPNFVGTNFPHSGPWNYLQDVPLF